MTSLLSRYIGTIRTVELGIYFAYAQRSVQRTTPRGPGNGFFWYPVFAPAGFPACVVFTLLWSRCNLVWLGFIFNISLRFTNLLMRSAGSLKILGKYCTEGFYVALAGYETFKVVGRLSRKPAARM